MKSYSIDEDGREVTSNFYTEEQVIAIFNYHKPDKASDYTFVCGEDSVMVVGDLDTERDMYNKYPQLESMTRRMMEENFSQVQEELAAFIASSPEERVKTFLMRRPALIYRVPQLVIAVNRTINDANFLALALFFYLNCDTLWLVALPLPKNGSFC